MRVAVADARVQPIRNVHTMPIPTGIVATPSGQFGWQARWYGSGGGAGKTTIEQGSPWGDYIRKTWTVLGTATLDVGYTLGQLVPIALFTRYMYAWFRCSQNGDLAGNQFARISVDFFDSTGTRLITYAVGNVGWVANTWTRVGGSTDGLIIPAGTVTFQVYINIYVASGAVGMTVDGTAAMFSGAAADFSDGSYPGWRWLGSPGASESVGYPRLS